MTQVVAGDEALSMKCGTAPIDRQRTVLLVLVDTLRTNPANIVLR